MLWSTHGPQASPSIGTGYLGATHAAAMAELGFDVLGLDVEPREDRDASQRGEVPRSFGPGSRSCCASTWPRSRAPAGGCASPPSFAEEVAEFGDVHFVCVNTPQKQGEYAVRHVLRGRRAFALLAPHLTGPAAWWSASPPCRWAHAAPAGRYCSRELAPAGGETELAWNPEFLREGFAVQDTLRPDRLVVGVRRRAGREACARSAPRRSPRARRSSPPTTRRPSW